MARLLSAVVALSLACAGQQPETGPVPSTPLPVGAMVGVAVTVYPLTLALAEETLGWEAPLQPRDSALRRIDSLIETSLTARSPEVMWVFPSVLRRRASQAPGMLVSPDRMATAVLRNPLRRVPDPLRSQMRSLTGAAGDRLALVPASVLFFREPDGGGRAELTLVLADVRLGSIQWRSVARGHGATPWAAVEDALQTLTPGMP